MCSLVVALPELMDESGLVEVAPPRGDWNRYTFNMGKSL